MNISPERMVEFITDHKLTPNQFLLCYFLHIDKIQNRNESGGLPSLTAKLGYLVQEHTDSALWTKVDIDTLIDRGFLINNNKPGENYTGSFEVVEYFADSFFIGEELFDEFMQAYPGFTEIRGQMATLKGGMSRRDLKLLYQSKISIDDHPVIVAAVKWGKNNGLIKIRIDRFIENELYADLISMMRKAYGEETDLSSLELGGLDDQVVI